MWIRNIGGPRNRRNGSDEGEKIECKSDDTFNLMRSIRHNRRHLAQKKLLQGACFSLVQFTRDDRHENLACLRVRGLRTGRHLESLRGAGQDQGL